MTKRLLVLFGLIPMLGFCAGIELFQTGPSATETAIESGLAEHVADLDNPHETTAAQVGALTSVWAATGTVSRAQMADMLTSSNGETWLEVVDGKTYIVEVTNSTSIYVVSTSGVGYNGPAAGTVWSGLSSTNVFDETLWRWGYPSTFYPYSYGAEIPSEPIGVKNDDELYVWASDVGEMPLTLDEPRESAIGSLVIDWIPITNRFEVAKQEPTLIMIKGSRVYDTYTNVPALSPTTVITPTIDASIYKVNLTTNTAIALNLSQLDFANQYATFEVEVTVPATNKVFTLPSTNLVYYVGGVPSLTSTKANTVHYFAFRAGATNDILCNKWGTKIP